MGNAAPVIGNFDGADAAELIVLQGDRHPVGVGVHRVPNQLGNGKDRLLNLRNALWSS